MIEALDKDTKTLPLALHVSLLAPRPGAPLRQQRAPLYAGTDRTDEDRAHGWSAGKEWNRLDHLEFVMLSLRILWYLGVFGRHLCG